MAGGTVVSSLSWLTTTAVGSLFKNKSTLGQIVVDFVFAVVVASLAGLTRGPKILVDIDSRSSLRLLAAIGFLLLWYITSITDLFVHEARTSQTRKAIYALILGEWIVLAFVVTAVYSVASLIAWQIVWLRLADETTRAQFRDPQRKFEVAIYALQFSMGLLAVLFAGLGSWNTWRTTGNITTIKYRLFGAAVSLWIWCTSELAFVVNYRLGGRWPSNHTGLARDTIFGLFMVAFYVLLAFDGRGRKGQHYGSGETSLRSDLRPVLFDMKMACRRYIVEKLQKRAQETEKPPPFADLLRDLGRTPTAPFRRGLRDERAALDASSLRSVDEEYKDYLDELQAMYGDWECSQVAREL